MDKNTIIGFVLIALVLIGFTIYSQPSAEEQAAMMKQDSIAAVQREKVAQKKKQLALQKQTDAKNKVLEDTTALFHSALQGQEQRIVLQNKNVALTLNSKGAAVEKAVIKGFKDKNGNPDVVLFDGKEQNLDYAFATKDANISTQDLYFQTSGITDSTVTFTAEAGEGKNIVLSYRLKNTYMLYATLSVNGMNGLFPPNTSTMDINWKDKCRQQEKGFSFENRYATLTYHKSDGGTKKLNETKEKIDEKIEDHIDWVAYKNQFFSAVMISKNDFAQNALLTSIPQQKGSGYLKQYESKLKAFFDPSGQEPTEFCFYYGPNDFRLLQTLDDGNEFKKDLELQHLVYLGWPLFRIINRWFTIYVFDWLSQIFSMGIVLILITLLLKVITFPMVKKSYMSSAKMRVLRPKLEEATKQYNKPEDQMLKQQAMMTEYSKYGVSPLSGCIPALIQMPIWIAMFNFVPNAIQLRGESFLWIKDLSTYDPLISWSQDLWLIGDHVSLTCILFCVSNILYSMMTMRMQQDQMIGEQAKQQMKMTKWMMYLMPAFFFFVFNDYSAGLNFYYFVSLFFSAAIMWLLRKTTNDEKLLAILEQHYNEKKLKPQKTSGFAARLQAMQEQQMELQRKRQELERKRKNL